MKTGREKRFGQIYSPPDDIISLGEVLLRARIAGLEEKPMLLGLRMEQGD